MSNSGGDVWGSVKTFVPANTALNKDTIPDLALWLDATDVNGDGNADNISDGTAVTAWVDKSNAPAITVNQGTASNQPLYKTTVFGTKSGIRFDGVNDFLAASPPIHNRWISCLCSKSASKGGLGDSGAY